MGFIVDMTEVGNRKANEWEEAFYKWEGKEAKREAGERAGIVSTQGK